MAQSLCPPLSEAWMLSAGWGPARPPPPASDGDCGCSPASDAPLPRGCPLCPDGGTTQAQTQACGPGLGSAAGAAASWGSPPACPEAPAAPELCNLPVRYNEEVCPEGLAMELGPSSPLFPGDVLALLETWMPLSPLEWSPA
ncbi:PREDICTED: mesoderm posterior protein 1 [Ceratotherium simum simum]|uniref:Mesoderm posterior protein 1 n=1 Tax=Ceratotherium simum simum TaxID=73337 RepID=A0ABM1CX79_CERSS|nr:PREDICTED: mesoderm posterior protein 1 [Ceratotherium simum simum]